MHILSRKVSISQRCCCYIYEMIIRQCLWSFDPGLREEIACDVCRKATTGKLGWTFGGVAVVQTDRGLALDFVFRGSQRHSARQRSWMLIREVAAEVYSRSRRQVQKQAENDSFSGDSYRSLKFR